MAAIRSMATKMRSNREELTFTVPNIDLNNVWVNVVIADADLLASSSVIELGVEFFLNGAWRGSRVTRTLGKLPEKSGRIGVSLPKWVVNEEPVDLRGLQGRIFCRVISGNPVRFGLELEAP